MRNSIYVKSIQRHYGWLQSIKRIFPLIYHQILFSITILNTGSLKMIEITKNFCSYLIIMHNITTFISNKLLMWYILLASVNVCYIVACETYIWIIMMDETIECIKFIYLSFYIHIQLSNESNQEDSTYKSGTWKRCGKSMKIILLNYIWPCDIRNLSCFCLNQNLKLVKSFYHPNHFSHVQMMERTQGYIMS